MEFAMLKRKSKANLWAECGDDYYYGRGGETVDYEMASSFYFKAMKRKHPRATYMLGLCYELGQGVERDLEYADILYGKAAEYGDEDAKKCLAANGASEEERSLNRLLKELPLPAARKAYTVRELERALKIKQKRAYSEEDDHIALTVALLLVKARFGTAAIFDDEALRARLAEYLPEHWEERRLAVLLFETGAIRYLPGEPGNAVDRLMATGLSWHGSSRLADCFLAALAVTVDYSGLTNDDLLAAAEYNDAEAMYFLATQCFEDGDNESYCSYLQKAAALGHLPALGLLEISAMFAGEDE
jgi:TPR repeat protein